MGWLRPRLALVVCGWLAIELCLFIAVPIALSPGSGAVALSAECTCEHGDGQMCPMHHTRSTSHRGSAYTCRGAFDPAAGLAACLIGPAGVLAPAAAVIPHAERVSTMVTREAEPLDVSPVPDSPPPRA